MSLDRSLKSTNALQRHRNVLTRAERIEFLKHEERWNDGDSIFSLPKVAHRKVAVGGKDKSTKPGEEPAADGEKTAETAPAS